MLSIEEGRYESTIINRIPTDLLVMRMLTQFYFLFATCEVARYSAVSTSNSIYNRITP